MHEEDDSAVPYEPIDGIFIDVARAEIVPPSWIIESLIPPGLTFLAGPPKSKKSTITAAAAALVAEYDCGALPPHLSIVRKKGPVLWFSAEALAGEIRHMLEDGLKMGPLEPREMILIAEDPWDFRLDDKDGPVRFLKWLQDRCPRLVIIDPLRDFHSLEEKDSGAMNRLLRPIRQWAVENDAAVMVVHHTKKLADNDRETTYSALDMRGTTALFGIADGVLMLTPRGESHENRLHIQATFKRARGWEKEIVLAAYTDTEAAENISELDTSVHSLISNGVTDVAEIASRLHVGMPEVLGALTRAKELKKGKQSWTTRKIQK